MSCRRAAHAQRHIRRPDRSSPGGIVPDNDLFQLALDITSSWYAASSDVDAATKQLEIRIAFHSGSRFACPDCNTDGCPAHDTTEKTWHHVDLLQHQAFLPARVPRVKCTRCGLRQVGVP